MFDRNTRLILALAVLAAIIGGFVARHQQPRPEVAIVQGVAGQSLPAISLSDLDGRQHALRDYLGRRLVLNFWASWCRPCLEEMPALNEAQEKFGENAPIVLGIAMDHPDQVSAFLAAHPVSYPILLGELGPPSTSQQLGNSSRILPYSVLIDTDGRIIATHEGALSPKQLEEWLAPNQRTR